jgi:hypothetical protein
MAPMVLIFANVNDKKKYRKKIIYTYENITHGGFTFGASYLPKLC